jgi:hypothetical protein
MSIKAVSWALEQNIGDSIAKLVLIGISDRYNDEYNVAWPSIKWLAIAASCSERTVMRKVQKLVEMGLLAVDKAPNKTNRYQIIPLHNKAGDTVSPSDTALSPSSDTHLSPEQYKTINNKNRKTKVCDWTPSDEDLAYAADKGLNGGEVLQAIRMWDQQNGNKAAYVDVQAFWRNWCMRDAKNKPKRVSGQPRAFNSQSTEWTPPQRRMVSLEQWQTMGDGLRTYYKQNRPDVIAELKKVGADV